MGSIREHRLPQDMHGDQGTVFVAELCSLFTSTAKSLIHRGENRYRNGSEGLWSISPRIEREGKKE
jgi:hypothetical protein